ncbi:hypothetical protein K461DRAFT_164728 [Myriangium duriaei CBS 260.36]|uniref:Erythromycin esterase n=1 Tax=Myriangium duriaei CBS 260.36 TaxID=1168546 RepID=A0A9P4IWM4_9PEZI|nr:hypothetical protein K461DRAFT_164728 [Myriangium duriaei CBS 260.36]
MARRSSARLRARNSATPQPSKTTDLLQDGRLRTPKTAPPLASVAEMDDMPGAFPQSVSPNNDTPTKLAKHIADAVTGKTRTPRHRSPRPSDEEMHPHRFQASTTKPLDEARWLGFSEMAPHTEPPKGVDKWMPAADTPTKANKNSDPQPGPFEFTFRAQSLELSSEARQMMAEKREEAARIKQEMARVEEEKQDSEDIAGRKIAKPKGKTGRFSDVHMAQFKKMDSIANHASASRPSSRDKMETVPTLKRTGSKAGLKQGSRDDDTKKSKPAEISKQQSRKEASLRRPSPEEGGSPAKRVRLDSPKSSTNLGASVIKVAPPSVQLQQSMAAAPPSPGKISYPTLSTPTKSSLAKAATVKANKTSMIPSLTRTPSKSASKAAPTKPEAASSLFARSPTKFAHVAAKHGQSEGDNTPLLSRSPTRKPKEESAETSDSGSKTPLLSRSPVKAGGDSNPFAAIKSTPGPQANLMNRFKLLRQSPIKSILRSPQRLYSDDPHKVANGTHLATPPPKQHTYSKHFKPSARLAVPATEPVVKHVDFSASTKSNDESPVPLSKSIIEPSTLGAGYPTLPSYPPLPSMHDTKSRAQRRQTLGPLNPSDFTFRVGSGITFGPSPSATTTSPKVSIRHVSAEPEPLSASSSRKRKFVEEEEGEDDVFAPALSDGPSDKENDVNTANIAAGIEARRAAEEEEARPAKRVRKGEATTTAAPAPAAKSAGPVKTPSWAQGTAAQKARASLAQQGKGKRTSTLPSVARGKSVRPSTIGAVGRKIGPGGKQAEKPGQEGKIAPAGEKKVVSRARLDALSQPKRR